MPMGVIALPCISSPRASPILDRSSICDVEMTEDSDFRSTHSLITIAKLQVSNLKATQVICRLTERY
jgi:hypothetical protein